jgi:hypothetical protein
MPRPVSQQNPPSVRVTAGVAEKVAQDARQQPEIAAQRVGRDVVIETEPCRFGHRLEFGHQRQQHFIEAINLDVGLDRLLVKLGNVEQVS